MVQCLCLFPLNIFDPNYVQAVPCLNYIPREFCTNIFLKRSQKPGNANTHSVPCFTNAKTLQKDFLNLAVTPNDRKPKGNVENR